MRRIIESPAATVGLKFDEGIVEDLAKEVAGDLKALPTLQFTLNKLWNERTGDRITWEAYRKVGKPREALIRTSDAVFASLSPDEQNVARKLFLELVHPTVEGGFIRRRIRRDVLMQIDVPPESVTRVLERYVEAGLIHLTPGIDWDGDRFDVAHEVLINNSPRLRDWLQREREESEKKLQLIATARLWQESGFKSGYLLSHDALDEAAAYTEATPELRQLVAASKEAVRRRRQRVAWIRNAVMAVMAILIVFAFWQRNNAVEQRANAEREAQAAQRSAETALKAVSSVLSVVAAQVDAGTIPIAAAKELLETAGRIFASVEQRQELAGTRADLLTKFSDLYVKIGDHNKALASAEETKALAERFVNKDADNDDWQRRLYESAFRIGDLLEAKDRERASQEFMLAVQIARNRAAKNPDNSGRQEDIAFIENKIGDISRAKGDPQQALEHYRAALAIGDQLMAREHEHPDRQKAVGDARMRIGELLAGQGRLSDALAEYQIALPIREALARNYPQNDIYQSNLSTSYDRLGTLYKRDNKPDQALLHYEKAFEIRDRLARKDFDNAEWQSALANEHVAIADVLAKQDPERAVERYRYALTIRERLAGKDAGNIPWTRNVADTYERIGDTLKGQGESRNAQGDLRNALNAYQKGLAVIEGFMRKDPNSGLVPVRDRLLKKIQGLAPSVQ